VKTAKKEAVLSSEARELKAEGASTRKPRVAICSLTLGKVGTLVLPEHRVQEGVLMLTSDAGYGGEEEK
jgi:hypothetical protein